MPACYLGALEPRIVTRATASACPKETTRPQTRQGEHRVRRTRGAPSKLVPARVSRTRGFAGPRAGACPAWGLGLARVPCGPSHQFGSAVRWRGRRRSRGCLSGWRRSSASSRPSSGTAWRVGALPPSGSSRSGAPEQPPSRAAPAHDARPPRPAPASGVLACSSRAGPSDGWRLRRARGGGRVCGDHLASSGRRARVRRDSAPQPQWIFSGPSCSPARSPPPCFGHVLSCSGI